MCQDWRCRLRCLIGHFLRHDNLGIRFVPWKMACGCQQETCLAVRPLFSPYVAWETYILAYASSTGKSGRFHHAKWQEAQSFLPPLSAGFRHQGLVPCNSGSPDGRACSTCHNKISKTGWPKQQKFIFSKFWRLEIHDQDSTCLVSPEACRWLPSCHVLTWPFLCAQASLVNLPFLIRTPVILDSVPTLMTLFNFNYLLKTLSPKTATS